MKENEAAVRRLNLQGTLTHVLGEMSASPNGHALAAVLKSIERELGSVSVRISPDMRRATVSLPNGRLATVRVTSAKPARVGGVFRFKTPSDLQKYDLLYFGGMARNGSPIVYKFRPIEIGRLKTITLKCAA